MIHVENLSFSFDESLILEEVSFEIEKGAFVALIGPNGGGKTTLLNLIMGFLHPKKGDILIEGVDPTSFRPNIGFVPQRMHFDRSFPISLEEVIRMGSSSKKSCDDEVERLLELFELQALRTQGFGTLSGGQLQRTLLARSLLSNPQLLLLDEATAGVDQHSEKIIYETLSSLKGATTILMVTHEIQKVISKADRVLCVQKRVLSIPPKNLCEHHAFGLYHDPFAKRGDL